MNVHEDSIIAIQRYLTIRFLPLLVLLLTLTILLIVCIRLKLMTKKFLLIIFLILGASLAYMGYSFAVLNYDVNNECYIVYNGKFDYKNVLGKNANVVSFDIEGTKKQCKCVIDDVDSGEYEGTIIYLINSGWVIFMETDKLIS